MDTKTITLLVVGVLLGAGIGVAAGYFLWEGDTDETYWYFFDFGDETNEENVNKWVKVEASDIISGLIKAADSAYSENDINETGWITSINGVSNDSNENLSWANWFLDQTADYNAYANWYATPGLDVTAGNVFYIGFFEYETVYYTPLTSPNDRVDEWKETGPFA